MKLQLHKSIVESSESDDSASLKSSEIAKELKLVKAIWSGKEVDRNKLSPYGRDGNKETKFKAASGVYFREYDIPEEGYFKKEKTVLAGRLPPFKETTGIPKDATDDDEPKFYTYYTYPQLESDL